MLCSKGYREDKYAACLCNNCRELLKQQLKQAADIRDEHIALLKLADHFMRAYLANASSEATKAAAEDYNKARKQYLEKK